MRTEEIAENSHSKAEKRRIQKRKASRKYYLRHKDEMLASSRKWKRGNPERVKAYQREYCVKNRAVITVVKAAYRLNNRDKISPLYPVEVK